MFGFFPPFEIGAQDFLLIGFLAFLEGILSIDNALVLALMARHLPKEQQRKALTYGLVGSVVFRLISLGMISQLMRWNWVKFVGGGYLIFIAAMHLLKKGPEQEHEKEHKGKKAKSFWLTVLQIEIMDIAFAIDSILAAVALSNKFWIVFIGGMMGVVLMRFAASGFLTLLHRFPGFETTAYLLVLIIGGKLTIEGFRFPWIDFHHASHPSFWVFWISMLLAFLSGFRRR